jgi:hypothetical protein
VRLSGLSCEVIHISYMLKVSTIEKDGSELVTA